MWQVVLPDMFKAQITEMEQTLKEKPDDEMGAMLFLSLPSLVVHRLDAWSPLVPPDWWVEAYYRRKRGDAPRKTSVRSQC